MMIKAVTITNYLGSLDEHVQRALNYTTYDTSNSTIHAKLNEPEPSHGWIIKKIEGLGPPKADINMTDLATTDGSKYNSSRMQTRNIVLTIGYDNCPDAEEARLLTYKYLPEKRRVYLSVETGKRNARVVGYVESNEPDIFSKETQSVISIICPDPFWYSNEYGYSPHILTFSGLDSEFEFLNENPEYSGLSERIPSNTEMGVMTSIVAKSFSYDGDQEIGIKMHIMFSNTVGENIIFFQTKNSLNPNEEEIQVSFTLDIERLNDLLDGLGLTHNFIAGDIVIINTSLGSKDITLYRGGEEYNILNAVPRDADWFQLGKGPNTFWFTTDNPSYMSFRIENYVIYEGV